MLVDVLVDVEVVPEVAAGAEAMSGKTMAGCDQAESANVMSAQAWREMNERMRDNDAAYMAKGWGYTRFWSIVNCKNSLLCTYDVGVVVDVASCRWQIMVKLSA